VRHITIWSSAITSECWYRLLHAGGMLKVSVVKAMLGHAGRHHLTWAINLYIGYMTVCKVFILEGVSKSEQVMMFAHYDNTR
jgi:hypothetical protein